MLLQPPLTSRVAGHADEKDRTSSAADGPLVSNDDLLKKPLGRPLATETIDRRVLLTNWKSRFPNTALVRLIENGYDADHEDRTSR